MTKVMLSVMAGVFVGAFAYELLNRKKPGFVHQASGRAKGAVRDFRRAFAEGYRGEGEVIEA